MCDENDATERNGALKPKQQTDLSDNLDKVLGVLRAEALYLASASLQGGSMGHNQDRVSCVKEVENIAPHSTDTITVYGLSSR